MSPTSSGLALIDRPAPAAVSWTLTTRDLPADWDWPCELAALHAALDALEARLALQLAS